MKERIGGKIIAFPVGGRSSRDRVGQPLTTVAQSTGTEQIHPSHPQVSSLDQRVTQLEQSTATRPRFSPGYISIHLLQTKRLKTPLSVVIEQDNGGFIARTVDFPLYGFGEGPNEAVEMLKREIESLYEDLMEDDDFSEKWLRVKQFLSSIIVD